MENTVTVESILALIHEMSRKSKEEVEEIRALFREREQQMQKEAQQWEKAAQEREKQREKEAQEREKQREKEAQEREKEMKEIRAQSTEAHKRISELGRRLGEIIEHIVSAHLEEKFKRFGIILDTVIVEHKIEEPGKGIIAEVDVFLTNNKYAVVVEAKSKPSIRDIDDHVKRMKTLSDHANRHNDHRKYLGAIAGMIIPPHVKEYAFKQGFPVLIPSGEGIELECPADFKPNEW